LKSHDEQKVEEQAYAREKKRREREEEGGKGRERNLERSGKWPIESARRQVNVEKSRIAHRSGKFDCEVAGESRKAAGGEEI
jgi:hypothetical protein